MKADTHIDGFIAEPFSRQDSSCRLVVGMPSMEYDFAALNRLMPHPVYARQWWVCVLNSGSKTFEEVIPLLTEAYGRAATLRAGKQPKRD